MRSSLISSTPQALVPPPGSDLRPVPGDPGRPVVGYTFDFLRDQVGWARTRYEQYGPVSWCRAFGTTFIDVADPTANEVVTANRDKVFSQSAWDYFIGRFFGRGLMLLDGDEHLAHRRIMAQAFSRRRLVGYADSMGPVIESGIASWQPGDQFLVYPAVKQLTLDVATRTFMGARLGPETDRVNRAFVDTVRAGTAFVRAPVPGGRWRRGLQGRRGARGLLRPAAAGEARLERARTCSRRCATRARRRVRPSATPTSSTT